MAVVKARKTSMITVVPTAATALPIKAVDMDFHVEQPL